MITKNIEHKLANDPKDYIKLINALKRNFKEWEFIDMEGVASLKDSVHFHIKSVDSKQKRVLEITLAPKLNGKVEIKVATNRMKEWSKNAVKELTEYLKK